MTATHSGQERARMLLIAAVAGIAVAAYALRIASPAAATTAAVAVGHFVAALAGAICVGGLALILITAQPNERGVLDPAAFRAHLVVERLSLLWFVCALAMVALQAAADAGVAVTRLLSGGGLAAALGASETARAWVAVALFAAIIAVFSRLTVRWEWHVPLLIPAVLGVVAVPVTGSAGQGPDHDYATSSAIVFALAFSLWAGLRIVGEAAPADPGLRRRVAITTVAAGSVSVVYGIALLALQVWPHSLMSGYGRLGLLVVAALLVGLAFGALTGAVAAIVALAALSLMAVQTAPRLLATEPTVWDVLLGYELAGAPTPLRLLTFWRFDTFLGVGALLLASLYVIGVARLRRRGDAWPAGRTVAWLAGCAALLLATSSGVRSYGSAMFSVHMVEHMTLNMFVPVLLVLGAPVTLALRVLPAAPADSPPGPREWIVRAVHSPFTEFLSNPITAFVLFVGSLYVVYFTPLFDTFVRYHWGHEFMALHFLITGYLFYWGIIGVDPGPRRLPFLGRLALLFAVMPFHAFFGLSMMSSESTVGENYYRGLALPWVPDINADQHLGGAIAWGASEVPLVIVVIALVTQWARQDRRDAVRSDRHADAGYDDDLEAYNNMLRELSRHRSSK
ncbi:MAG: cytochrome c oxidase assembly protein [Mycobacterium sp.]